MSKTHKHVTDREVCESKVRYLTEGKARYKADKLGKEHYWCYVCKGYHLRSIYGKKL